MQGLVEKGVLPGECYGKEGFVAPGLVGTRRRVERERVKDVLRGWVVSWREKGCERGDSCPEERIDVRRLAKRFASREAGLQIRRANNREDPARAQVLGLRRFWERVGREGTATSTI